MRKDFLTTKYYYKTKPDGSKRQLYHDSFFSPVYFLLLCKPLTPKISFVILLVKFPHSPILHYAFSSWIEKTMTLPLGKQISFTIVWGCAEILPYLVYTMMFFKPQFDY